MKYLTILSIVASCAIVSSFSLASLGSRSVAAHNPLSPDISRRQGPLIPAFLIWTAFHKIHDAVDPPPPPPPGPDADPPAAAPSSYDFISKRSDGKVSGTAKLPRSDVTKASKQDWIEETIKQMQRDGLDLSPWGHEELEAQVEHALAAGPPQSS